MSRAEAEALAAERWVRRPQAERDPDSYWVGTMQVAAILQVTHSRVWQLAERDLPPYVLAANGDRLFRRHQVKVIANARSARHESTQAT